MKPWGGVQRSYQLGSPNPPSALLESNRRRKQLICGKLLPYIAKEEQRAGAALCSSEPTVCRTTHCWPMWCFSSWGPLLASRISLELCPCLLSALSSLCHATACDAFSHGLAAKESGGSPAAPSPTRPARSEGERQRNRERHRCQSSRSQKRSVCFSCNTVISSSLLPSPVLIPSPALVPALPGAHFGTKVWKIRSISILWEQKVSFVVIPLFSSAQGPRMGHSNTHPVWQGQKQITVGMAERKPWLVPLLLTILLTCRCFARSNSYRFFLHNNRKGFSWQGKKQGVGGRIYHRYSLARNDLYHLYTMKWSLSASQMLSLSVVALIQHGGEGDVKGWGLEDHVKILFHCWPLTTRE